jgi:hypothetical protein
MIKPADVPAGLTFCAERYMKNNITGEIDTHRIFECFSEYRQNEGVWKKDKQSCKPGSVLDDHLSWTAVTDSLQRPT